MAHNFTHTYSDQEVKARAKTTKLPPQGNQEQHPLTHHE